MKTTWDNIKSVLDNHGLHKSGGQWRSNNPTKPGSNSNAFSIKVDPDGEHGTFYNHAGDEQGNLWDLAKLLNVDIVGTSEKRHRVKDTKRKYTNLKDYAEAHGGQEQWFKDAGWEFSLYSERPCFKYPTATGIRYRFIDNKIDDDGKRLKTYTSTIGYKACFYGLDKAIAIAKENNHDFIVICNGESSTIVGQHFNIPVFCKTGGENPLPENLLEQLNDKWTGKIVIALDNDTKGKGTADKLKVQLPNSIIADLMQGDHGDLADHCKLHTTDSLNELKRLFSEQNPVKVINTHETDENISKSVRARLKAKMRGEAKVQTRYIPMPIIPLRKFGGICEFLPTGKVTGIAGGSGTGKTQFLETMVDELNRQNFNVLFWGVEWSDEEMELRRIIRNADPFTRDVKQKDGSYKKIKTQLYYNQVQKHLANLGDEEDGIAFGKRQGQLLSVGAEDVFYKCSDELDLWPGETEYFKMRDTLEDTFEDMRIAVERGKLNNRQFRVVVFDYVQLLNVQSPDKAVNRYEYAVEKVKEFAIQQNIHVIFTSQVNQQPATKIKQGKSLGLYDAHWIRPDKFNLFLTINQVFESKGDSKVGMPYYWLNIVKASYYVKSTIGYGGMRIPITMQPTRFTFETSQAKAWTNDEKNRLLWQSETPTYIDNNQSILDNIPG